MPETVLRLISKEPEHVPDPKALERARTLLVRSFPEARISVVLHDTVRFVDCGENFGRAACPRCGKDLLPEGRWLALMTAAEAKDNADLMVTLPCCGKRESLNRLDYQWECGFARLVLEISGTTLVVDGALRRRLERMLGCRLREIPAYL